MSMDKDRTNRKQIDATEIEYMVKRERPTEKFHTENVQNKIRKYLLGAHL